jgi:hypothetical protein
VKRVGYCFVPVQIAAMLMLALLAWSAMGGNRDMKTAAFAAEIPPIDLIMPAKIETATFALG